MNSFFLKIKNRILEPIKKIFYTYCTLIVGHLGLVAEPRGVVAGVEVHGVGDVGVAGQRALRNNVHVLVPVGRADNDHVVLIIFADHVDDLKRTN